MKIFISYRRADSEPTAGRMAQFLDAVQTVQAVFLDVDDIQIGADFQRRIGEQMTQSSHVFLLMGKDWQGPSPTGGGSRLFDADDIVRHETRLALAGKARVVPILLDNARMPRVLDLPPELAGLAALNAFSLRTPHFDEDMDNLLDALAGRRPARGSRWQQAPRKPAATAARMLAGLLAGLALLVLVGVLNRLLVAGCDDLACTLQKALHLADENDALGLMAILAGLVLLGSALAPVVLDARRNGR